ncbi:MAG: hypothetical protein ACKPKO_58095 [Candidatus Fonsibacter sp.]
MYVYNARSSSCKFGLDVIKTIINLLDHLRICDLMKSRTRPYWTATTRNTFVLQHCEI